MVCAQLEAVRPLAGHLACLAMTDLYRFLSQEHDPTLVGVLLGMSAAKRLVQVYCRCLLLGVINQTLMGQEFISCRGSMDPVISKMLFLHLPNRHPAGYPELEISPLVQTAAVVGLGLLYQGSSHRSIVDILVQEIGRSPGPRTANGQQQSLHHVSETNSSRSTVSLAVI